MRIRPVGRRHRVCITKPDSTGCSTEKSKSSASAPSRAATCFSVPPRAPGGLWSSWRTWGRLGSRSDKPSSRDANDTANGSRSRSAASQRAEEAIAIVEDARAGCSPLVAFLGEGRAAVVVDVGGVLDEVAVAVAGGAQAEVDLFAVAAPEGVLVEDAAAVEGAAGHVHAEPDAGDDLGAQPADWRATNSAHSSMRGSAPSRSKASITGRGKRADRAGRGQRRDGRDVGLVGRVGQSVQPSGGHDRVRVQQHHVAAAGPEPLVARLDEAEVRRRGASPAPEPGGRGPRARRGSPRSAAFGDRSSITSSSIGTDAPCRIALSMQPTVSSNPS